MDAISRCISAASLHILCAWNSCGSVKCVSPALARRAGLPTLDKPTSTAASGPIKLLFCGKQLVDPCPQAKHHPVAMAPSRLESLGSFDSLR